MKDKDTPDNSSVNIDLIRGHMDTIILRTLSDGDKYGYEILSEISDKSDGLYSLKQPTLYSCLKRLEKQGLVTSYKGDLSYGAQRVYYSLTDMGKQFLENDQIQWEFSRTIINSLLSDKDYDPEKSPKPFDVSSFRPLTRRQRGDANYYATVDPSRLPEEDTSKQAESKHKEFDTEYDGNVVYSENANVTPVHFAQASNEDKFDTGYDDSADIVEDGYIAPLEEHIEDDAAPGEVSQSQTKDEEFYGIYDDEGYDDSTVTEDSAYVYPSESATPKYDDTYYSADSYEDAPAQVYDEPKYAESHAEPTFKANYSNYYDEEARKRAADVLYGAPPVEEAPEEEPAPPRRTQLPPQYSEVNYIESLGKIYNRREDSEPEQEEKKKTTHMSDIDDAPTLNQVREMFYVQGYTLKPYTKTTNAGYYINKYFYSNRLLRDCTFAVYAIFIVELVICALAGGISWGAFGLAAGISLIAPIFMFIIYAVSPDRRKRATYNFKSATINCIAFCICYIALVFILGFFVFGVRADMADTWIKPVVIPLVFMIDAPIAVLIYSKLYSSRRYHIN